MKYVLIIAIAIAVISLFFGVEFYIARHGPYRSFTNPSPTPLAFGQGQPLSYVVLGDSTAAGQGAPYDDGIAVGTAKYLATNRSVSLVNLAWSGATSADVLRTQVDKAVKLKPDIVLLAVGANDVTHLVSTGAIRNNVQQIVDKLVAANCNVKIVLTGSPDMGSTPRVPQPLRWLAGVRTTSVNKAITNVVTKQQLTFAPIAKETGPKFRADHSLFDIVDKFHPNARGYALWLPVLNKALAESLNQPKHCNQ